MAETTTSIRFEAPGPADVLQYKTVPTPVPGPGEVRLAVEAIGVGYGECLYRMGYYVHKTVAPGSLGNNVVGTVDAVGDGVSSPAVGDRVSLIPLFPMSRHPVYGRHVVVPAVVTAPYFDSLTAEDIAALWMQVSTAYGALVVRAPIARGDVVLVIPASGGVGKAAIELVVQTGGVAIGVTRSAAKAAAIRDAGAAHVIVTSEEDLVERVQVITGGKGVEAVFNALTGDEVMADRATVTRDGGAIVQYGGIGGHALTLPLVPFISKGLNFYRYTLYEMGTDAAMLDPLRAFVVKGVAAGAFKPRVGKVFQFEEMVEVHRYLEAGSMDGSVVVRVS